MKTTAIVLLLTLAVAASPILAEGPASTQMEPFAPLVGAWDCATFSPDGEGGVKEGRAQWTFWWILDGHALMDEWRAPKPDGAFVMEGDAETPDGRKGRSRITFHDISDTTFQWRMDWSLDGGATWKENVFRIVGTRRD